MSAGVFPFVARRGEERQNSPQRRREMLLVSRHTVYFKLNCINTNRCLWLVSDRICNHRGHSHNMGTRYIARVCQILGNNSYASDHSWIIHYTARSPISGRAVEFRFNECLTQELVDIGYPAIVLLPVTRDGSTDNYSFSYLHVISSVCQKDFSTVEAHR